MILSSALIGYCPELVALDEKIKDRPRVVQTVSINGIRMTEIITRRKRTVMMM
jgi:hypothetical protein